MLKRFVVFTSLFWLCSAQIALADAPQITRQGDYLTKDGFVYGTSPRPNYDLPGALWRVISPTGLNCRRKPDLQAEVILTFSPGTILQAGDLGRGGSDEVMLNLRDHQGRTWMTARSRNGHYYGCYVRANRRYIQPVQV